MTKPFAKTTLILVETSRLIAPFFIFPNPLVPSILVLTLDSIDGSLFYKSGYNWKVYNLIDKLLDYWWYIFIVIYSLSLPIFPIILILFAYRTIGQLLGLLTQNEKVYIFFPNILEKYFYLFVVLTFLGYENLFLKTVTNSLILIISISISLFTEWAIHKKKIYLTQIILFGKAMKWKKND